MSFILKYKSHPFLSIIMERAKEKEKSKTKEPMKRMRHREYDT
jgi:hypothetical protein